METKEKIRKAKILRWMMKLPSANLTDEFKRRQVEIIFNKSERPPVIQGKRQKFYYNYEWLVKVPYKLFLRRVSALKRDPIEAITADIKET
jgi:hypothetical protein